MPSFIFLSGSEKEIISSTYLLLVSIICWLRSRLPRKEGARKKKKAQKGAQKKASSKKKIKEGAFKRKKKGWRKEGASKSTEKIPEKHTFEGENVVN